MNFDQQKQRKNENDKEGKEVRCGERNDVPTAAFRRSSLMMRSPARSLSSIVSGTDLSTSNYVGLLLGTPTMYQGSLRGSHRECATSDDAARGLCLLSAAAPVGRAAETLAEDEIPATMVKESSPRLEMLRKMRRMEEEAFPQCKTTLSGIQRAINRQENVSNEVKTGISKMLELLDVMLNFKRSWKAAEGERALSDLRRNAATLQSADAPTPKLRIQRDRLPAL